MMDPKEPKVNENNDLKVQRELMDNEAEDNDDVFSEGQQEPKRLEYFTE